MSKWNEVPFPTDAGVLNLPHTRLNPGDLLAGGQANALRSLIKGEQDRSPDFLRLANALSAL